MAADLDKFAKEEFKQVWSEYVKINFASQQETRRAH